MNPASVAEAYWMLHSQTRDAWTHELDLRPYGETVVRPMTDVIFYFDFGSPNAYLAHKVIPAIEARTGARFDYVPALLGGIFKATGNRSPAEAFAGIPSKLRLRGQGDPALRARHGITDYARNPHFPVNTLQIMRGAVAAQRLGVFEPYVEAVFRAMWVRGAEDGRPGGDRGRARRPPACRPTG